MNILNPDGKQRACSCRFCLAVEGGSWWMVVCEKCGSKRCPHADDHREPCVGVTQPKPANVSEAFKDRIRELNRGLPDDGSWQIGPTRGDDDDTITAERLQSVGFTQAGMVFSWQYGYSCGTRKTVDVWIGENPSVLLCGYAPFPHVTTWSRFQTLLSLLKPEE